MSDTVPTFKTAAWAIQERRQLLRDLRLGLALALIMLCLALGHAPITAQLLAWGVTLALLAGLWRLDGESLLTAFAGRELRIQGNALELVEGGFTKLLFFDQLEQLRMSQSRDEKVLALELRTLDGALLLSGFENMEMLFAQLNERKPPRVMLEVEEMRWNRQSVGVWSKAVFAGGTALMVLLFFFGGSENLLKALSGVLLVALAAFVAWFRPFSRNRDIRVAWAEWGLAFALAVFGIWFLI